MALANALAEDGFTPESIHTTVSVDPDARPHRRRDRTGGRPEPSGQSLPVLSSSSTTVDVPA